MKNVADAARELEAVLLRQLFAEAKAFGGSGAGAHVYGDFFVNALADAVVKGGGLGLASVLERSLGGASAPDPRPQPLAHAHEVRVSGRETSKAIVGALPSLSSLEDLVASGHAHISSRFGPRNDPIHGRATFHHGVDIAAPAGTPILVARDGVVSFAGERGGYGLVVEVDHGDGLVTRYAHASRLHVRAGEHVAAGAQVADVGSTGRSTGPHVHVEAFERGKRVDPAVALQNGGPRDEL